MKLRFKALFIACLAAVSLGVFTACGNGDKPEPDGPGNEQQNEYGTVSVENVKVYIDDNKNYTFAELNPVFSKPDKAETLEYQYSSDIKIENNVVIPLKRTDKSVGVRAKCEHFNTTFYVEIERITYTGANASSLYDVSRFPVDSRKDKCAQINGNTTLLIGDSFMDDYFIGNYMSSFAADKEIINAGMSSTRTYHWEREFSNIIGATAPKNIAIHIGTNNFYDNPNDTVQDAEASLTRLMMYIHNRYPETNVYWFNITQRTDTAYAQRVTETNAYMAEWCAKYDWITCVDTCSKMNSSLLLEDGIHPNAAGYKVFTDELVKAGCEIISKN